MLPKYKKLRKNIHTFYFIFKDVRELMNNNSIIILRYCFLNFFFKCLQITFYKKDYV